MMSVPGSRILLSPRDYEAVLFDLDGVLTKTARVHAAAWKQLFDAFLQERAQQTGEAFVAFDEHGDYGSYVDGKPRYEGVAAFLEARGIALPRGEHDAAPGEHSIYGLGKLKDRYFEQQLELHGVAVYESTLRLVRALREHGVKIGVVSSSVHCADVLRMAGIEALFDVRIDGHDLEHGELRGKPAPDTFLAAAQRLHVDPRRAVVVEDALSGVAAGRAGGFGLVIGVDRLDRAHALREAGADLVVVDLALVSVSLERASSWSLVYETFDAPREGIRESLCALGNGYFTTRGAACWAHADADHYPGTYLAGGYNRLTTHILGREIENESLVNFPNWLGLALRIGDGTWFDARSARLLAYRQELDLGQGILKRSLRFEDDTGRRTTFAERRLVSMHEMHLGALEWTIQAENWSGPISLRLDIDGRVVNRGAKLYLPFNAQHLEPLHTGSQADTVELRVRTSQSRLEVAQAARIRLYAQGEELSVVRRACTEPGYAAQELTLELAQGSPLTVEKVMALYTSRDNAISECGLAARKASARAGRFEVLLAEHALTWRQLWLRYDVHVEPVATPFALNLPMLLRLNMFQLLQAVSLNSIGLDVGVPARAWTGEAYEGHIFWDELFIFPFFNYRMPEITRSLLMYRYRRLPEARAAALEAGLAGAMFPWQSGSDGQEETQDYNLNPRSKRWMKDHTYLQRHVGSAIAYNVWQYFEVTADLEFLQFYGAELILEIARFWSSLASFNNERERYEIRGVLGPDEFHDAYPDAEHPGLDNNAYTNLMAAWVLQHAAMALDALPELRRRELQKSLRLTAQETERWDDISRRMFVPFHDGDIISQFEGYERLEELDWQGYRSRYGDIQRLDLILEAEQDSPNHYKLSKQADVLMLFYVFSADELRELLARVGYRFEPEAIARNVAYYDQRSSHGSTLSRVVHAWVLARADRPRAMRFLAEALQSDISDIQQGTTAEGIHLGAMAGAVDLVQRVSTGLEATDGLLRINPGLPDEMQRLDMRVRYRGHTLDLRVSPDELNVYSRELGAAPIRIACRDEHHELPAGATCTLKLVRRPSKRASSAPPPPSFDGNA